LTRNQGINNYLAMIKDREEKNRKDEEFSFDSLDRELLDDLGERRRSSPWTLNDLADSLGLFRTKQSKVYNMQPYLN